MMIKEFALRVILLRGINAVGSFGFSLASIFFLNIDQFSSFAIYSVSVGIVFPLVNSGISDYFISKNNLSSSLYFFLTIVISFLASAAACILYYILGQSTTLLEVSAFLLIIVFYFSEPLSRYMMDMELKFGSPKKVEYTNTASNFFSLLICFIFLFAHPLWQIIALKPILFSLIKLIILVKPQFFLLDKSEISLLRLKNNLISIKPLMIFNFKSSFIESIDKIIYPYYNFSIDLGLIERLSSFSRITDSTFRVPVYKYFMSSIKSPKDWLFKTYMLFPLLVLICIFAIATLLVKYDLPTIYIIGYLLFGIGWVIRGVCYNTHLHILRNTNTIQKSFNYYFVVIFIWISLCYLFFADNPEILISGLGLITFVVWSFYFFKAVKTIKTTM